MEIWRVAWFDGLTTNLFGGRWRWRDVNTWIPAFAGMTEKGAEVTGWGTTGGWFPAGVGYTSPGILRSVLGGRILRSIFVLVIALFALGACANNAPDNAEYDITIFRKDAATPMPTPTLDPSADRPTPTPARACIEPNSSDDGDDSIIACPTPTPSPTPASKKVIEIKQKGAEWAYEIDLEDVNIQGVELLPTATRIPRATRTPTPTPTPTYVVGFALTMEGRSSQNGHLPLGRGRWTVELAIVRSASSDDPVTASTNVTDETTLSGNEVGWSDTGTLNHGIGLYNYRVISNANTYWKLTFTSQ